MAMSTLGHSVMSLVVNESEVSSSAHRSVAVIRTKLIVHTREMVLYRGDGYKHLFGDLLVRERARHH